MKTKVVFGPVTAFGLGRALASFRGERLKRQMIKDLMLAFSINDERTKEIELKVLTQEEKLNRGANPNVFSVEWRAGVTEAQWTVELSTAESVVLKEQLLKFDDYGMEDDWVEDVLAQLENAKLDEDEDKQ